MSWQLDSPLTVVQGKRGAGSEALGGEAGQKQHRVQGGGPPKGGGQKGRGRGSGSAQQPRQMAGDDDYDLDNMVMAMQKMLLRLDASQREQIAITCNFYLVPWLSPVSTKMIECGIKYQEAIRERGRGHGLGSAHIQVAVAMVKGCIETAESPHLEILKTWLAYAEQCATPAVVEETILACRSKEAYGGPQGDEAKPEDRKTKVLMAFNTMADWEEFLPVKKDEEKSSMEVEAGGVKYELSILNLRRSIHKTILGQGGLLRRGAGPKEELTRVVERDLKKLQRRRGGH